MTLIELTGPSKGVKKILPLKNPDILGSTFLKRKNQLNNLTLKQNKDKTLFVYHSFDSVKNGKKTYGGRWYNVNLKPTDLNLCENKKQLLHIIPKWEGWDDNDILKVRKNLPMIIKFSDKGWRKLNKFLAKLK